MLKTYNETIKDASSNEVAYSIKVGKNVPHRGVNLAYVESSPISPNKNIALSSYATTDSTTYVEKLMNPDSSMKLVCNEGDDMLPSDELTITDEFSIPSTLIEKPVPLYYVGQLSTNIKLNDADLVAYQGGYVNNTIEYFLSKPFSSKDYDKFIYIGKKIQLRYENGTNIKSKYKIVIVKDNINQGKVFIYSEKQETGVHVSYDSISGRKNEVINLYPFFSRDNTLDDYLTVNNTLAGVPNFNTYATQSNYSVKLEGDRYSVYVPTQNLIANDDNRHSYNFRYRVEANKRLRYDISQTGIINVGVYAINPTNDEDPLHAMSSIYSQLTKKPSFITFDNPHPPIEIAGQSNAKNQAEYWKIDLDMPEEHYNDYDVIIISGKGSASLSRYNQYINSYLQSGGSIWIDNSGDGGDSLVLETDVSSSFLVGVQFDDVVSTPIPKKIVKDELDVLSRYYTIKEDSQGILQLGHKDVSPRMTLSESSIGWSTLIKYGTTTNPALMYKRMYQRGLIFASNCGIMMGVLDARGNAYDHSLAVNLLMILGEDKWYTTPWIYDYVLHKDQIFSGEFGNDVGEYSMEHKPGSTNLNDKVAMKKLALSAESLLDSYHHINTAVKSENYIFHVEEIKEGKFEYEEGDIATMAAKKVELTNKKDPLYIYTTNSHGKAFNPSELGYYDTDIHLLDANVDFSLCIYACTYVWSDTSQKYSKVIGITKDVGYNADDRSSLLSIKKSEGLKKIVDMTINTPPLPSGIEWSDRYNIFYEVALGNSDTRGQSQISLSNKPVTLIIQNIETGEIYTNVFGDPSIPYEILFDDANRGKIAIYATTTYQNVIATKRRFSVKSLKSAPINVTLPDEIDEREQWYLRVSNGIHSVTDTRMSYEPKLVYEVNDYHEQLFLPEEPFRQVTGETARYIDYNRISVGRTPMYIQDTIATNHRLFPIGTNQYQSTMFTQWDKDYNISVSIVSYADPANPAAVLQQNYNVDYDNGIVTLLNGLTLADNEFMVATFKHKNLSVSKVSYSNTSVKRQSLTVLSIETNKTIYKLHNNCFKVRLYTIVGGTETDLSVPYSLDQDLGVLEVQMVMTVPVYADYKYFDVSPVKISGVDVNRGIIYTDEEIRLTDKINVDYFYEEKCFDYKGYYDGKDFIKLDLNPSIGHKMTTVRYSSGNKIVEEVPTSSMLNKPAFVYILPSYSTTEYIAKIPTGVIEFKADGTIARKLKVSNPNDIPKGAVYVGDRTFTNLIESGSLVSKIAFLGSNLDIPELGDETAIAAIQKYNNPNTRVKVLGPNEYLMPIDGIAKNYNNQGYDYITCYVYNKHNIRHTFSKDELKKAILSQNAILIAEVHVKSHMKPEDVIVMDARVRGGGLIKSLTRNDINKLFPEAMNFWDIGEWDGIAYQKNGVTIISLPSKITDIYTEQYIKDVVNKYIACGIEYIIEYR